MDAQCARLAGYAVPTYEAAAGSVWYHFLHGNVPGHQIDFMYRPDVPQGALTRQHFSHLARLVKYIEPRAGSAYAFAIGNLSRDDTQYEAGRGGVALIFGLRIRGAKDHAGRQDPPFSHAAAAIGRHLDEATLLEASLAFYHKLLPDEESQAEGSGWYHTYVRHAENRHALAPLLRAYTSDFDDLPAPRSSGLGLRWTAEKVTQPKRIVIAYPDRTAFAAIACCAARIAAVLVESDIRWTVISNGREADVPGGVSVRLLPVRDLGPEEETVIRLEDVPAEPEAIARQLFGAEPVRASRIPEMRMGWRQLYARDAEETRNSGEAITVQIREGFEREPRKSETGTNLAVGTAADGGPRRSKATVFAWVGLCVALAIGGAVAAVAVRGGERRLPDEAMRGVSAAAPTVRVESEPAAVAASAIAPPAVETSVPVAAASASAVGAESAKVGPRAPAPRAATRKKRVFDATPDFRR
ncbi:hypothetical protein [Polyangium aurulentum]|uniref:hypothetical protein n=1 Tax=Polyangium aurulentum TaxID=2567896 RepID=UPI0010ADC19A|nr:hypothetical protein [Polyangium aurulentum]UQA61202.1 hypothetical protein E8A73_012270 [Polyangium aurulentum]